MHLRSKRKLGLGAVEAPPAKRMKSQQAATNSQRASIPRAMTNLTPCRASPRLRQKNNSSNGKSGLLSLPPELRNSIYGLILLRRPVAVITMNECSQDSRPPALLQVCTQIRKEAAPIYYTCNHFNLDTYGLNLHLRVTWACVPAARPVVWTPTLHVGKCHEFDLQISIGTAEENNAVRDARARVKAITDEGCSAFNRKKLRNLMVVLHDYGKVAYERDMRLLARLRHSLAALRSRAEEMQALLTTSAPRNGPAMGTATASGNAMMAARIANVGPNIRGVLGALGG